MGYQALLFCPDEKTARTVTQVLSELEFEVEPCAEPFAAVKKLMGQHFDAVVVDCDNEQNATLLFKSARNSASNQASLAVAVVEGQAGVAKAFRIGANLVLTKPINIEQAKGTLRVARGLLRKGDPAKPIATPTPATSATPVVSAAAPTAPAVPPASAARPVAAKPVAPAKPPTPAAPKTLSAAIANPRPIAPPVAKPVTPVATAPANATKPAIPAPVAKAPVAKAPVANPVANDDDLLDVSDDAMTVPSASSLPAMGPTVSAFAPAAISGAASAPAPARIPEAHIAESVPASRSVEVKPVEDEPLFDRPAEASRSESTSHIGSEPTFTFGGANVPEPSSGSSKKIVIGVAAAVLVAAAGYFGWTKFQESKSANIPAHVAAPTPAKPAITPTAAQAAAPSAATTTPDITLSNVPDASAKAAVSPASAAPPKSDKSNAAASPTSAATAAARPAAESSAPPSSETTPSDSQASAKKTASAKPAAPALVVKGGSAPVLQAKNSDPDAPAPSISAPSAGAAMPNLGSTSHNVAKPVLQTLTVSQGVSQGLLIKKVQPFYPKSALAMQVEGSVEIVATISKSGDISHVTVVSGDSQLTKAAADAVKQWKYKPYLLNGEPVEIKTQVTINFKLPR